MVSWHAIMGATALTTIRFYGVSYYYALPLEFPAFTFLLSLSTLLGLGWGTVDKT